MRRAANETSRVRNSYYTLGIQRGGLLLSKVGGIVRHPERFLGFPCGSQRKVALGYRYGNLLFPVGKRLPVLDCSYYIPYDRGRGMIIYGQRGSTIGIVGREVTRDGGHGSVPVLVPVPVLEYRHRALDKAMIQRTSTCVMYDNIIMYKLVLDECRTVRRVARVAIAR